MTLEVKKTFNTEGLINMLLYGPSGAGKTVYCSTAPKVLVLDVEGGLMSIRGTNVAHAKIDCMGDIGEAYLLLKGSKEYDTVAIDSITELQKRSMTEIIEADGNAIPSMKNWGQNIEEMRKIIRAFRDLPINVIFTALESTKETEDGLAMEKQPALQGKSLPQEVMGFVDIVGHMEIFEKQEEVDGKKSVKVYRAIRVQPSKTVNAKDRSKELGTWIKQDLNGHGPSFADMYSKVFGKKKAQTEKVADSEGVKKETPATAKKKTVVKKGNKTK